MSDNDPKKEDFKLLDFEGNPIEEAESIEFQVDEVKFENNQAKETVAEVINEPAPVIQKVGNQSIELKQVTSIEELSPEMQNTVKKLLKSVSKEELNELVQDIEQKKEIMFDKKNENSAFGKLSSKEQDVLKEKMTEWNVPKELTNLNASVILSWVNNTIKENK